MGKATSQPSQLLCPSHTADPLPGGRRVPRTGLTGPGDPAISGHQLIPGSVEPARHWGVRANLTPHIHPDPHASSQAMLTGVEKNWLVGEGSPQAAHGSREGGSQLTIKLTSVGPAKHLVQSSYHLLYQRRTRERREDQLKCVREGTGTLLCVLRGEQSHVPGERVT